VSNKGGGRLYAGEKCYTLVQGAGRGRECACVGAGWGPRDATVARVRPQCDHKDALGVSAWLPKAGAIIDNQKRHIT